MATVPDRGGTTESALHQERLDAVTNLLLDHEVRTVLDLGCGTGALLQRLASADQVTRIVGVDASAEALQLAEQRLAAAGKVLDRRVSLRHASYLEVDERLAGFDAAAMIETIEHIPTSELSKLEHAVFVSLRPKLVVMTTPNGEYNELYGLGADEARHRDHQFEWSRSRFASWAGGVARRCGFRISIRGVGPRDPMLGCPTQLALFRKVEESHPSADVWSSGAV